MSNPAETIHEEHEFNKKENVINDITLEAYCKVLDIDNERPQYTNNVTEALQWNASEVRIRQLEALVKLVADGIIFCIDLNNTQLDTVNDYCAEIRRSDLYDLFREGAEVAIQQGLSDGTKDFLKIFAPEEIIDEDMREICFLPWPKYLIEQQDQYPLFTRQKDGSSWVSFPTRIDEIEVRYEYSPEGKLEKQILNRLY